MLMLLSGASGFGAKEAVRERVGVSPKMRQGVAERLDLLQKVPMSACAVLLPQEHEGRAE